MRTLTEPRRVAALVLSFLSGFAIVTVFGVSSAVATPVPGDGKNTMEVAPADAGVVAVGDAFTVSVNLVEAELEYMAAIFQLEWSDAALDYVSSAPGPLTQLAGPETIASGTPPGTEEVSSGGISPTPQVDTGKLWDVTLRCAAAGVHSLHLVPISEDPASGTATAVTAGEPHPMVLQDGQVTCQGEGGPVPTATAEATPGLVPVPGGPAPTPTPLPPGLEAVPLAAGCNPVTSTYPDASPIQTIADAVGPAGSLVSLWKFDAGTWRAYSPQYPQASDLTATGFLDVLFTCVGGSGAFVRPIV